MRTTKNAQAEPHAQEALLGGSPGAYREARVTPVLGLMDRLRFPMQKQVRFKATGVTTAV